MDRLGGFGLFVLPAWLWALLLLWVASGGVIDPLEVMLLFATAVPVVLVWIVGVTCVRKEKRTLSLLWLSVPVVCVAAIVLSATDTPMIVRFRLSEPALRRYAEGNDPNPPHYTENAKAIGLFRVNKVWRHERMVAFATDGKPFVTAGVVYAPDGLPKELPIESEELLTARYVHISGPWYKFEMGD